MKLSYCNRPVVSIDARLRLLMYSTTCSKSIDFQSNNSLQNFILMKQILIIFCFGIFMSGQLNAQQLLCPSYGFSHKKTSYITLQDGTEIQGNIKDIDREKGLIKFIKIKDGAGKKHKLKPEAVKHMYLPPSGLDKLSTAADFLTDTQKWNDDKLNQDLLNQGYVYFELADGKVKKKNKKNSRKTQKKR